MYIQNLMLLENLSMSISFQVESEETLATIIDFSLSRAEVEGQLIFNNLAEDPAVFQVSETTHLTPR